MTNNEYQSPKPLPFTPDAARGVYEYVNLDNPWMQRAREVRSGLGRGCNWSVGAVLVRDDEELSVGGNNEEVTEQPLFCVRRVLGCTSGVDYHLCDLCSGSHAEQSALKKARQNNIDVSGATVYLYGHWWGCKSCWDELVQAGVSRMCLVERATELFEAQPSTRQPWFDRAAVCVNGEKTPVRDLFATGLSQIGVKTRTDGVSVFFDQDAVWIADRYRVDTRDMPTALRTISTRLFTVLRDRFA